jgi:hypothetical protein
MAAAERQRVRRGEAAMKRRSMLNLAGALAATSMLRPRRVLAQTQQAMRDVVVLVPGITGSVLRKDGKDLWALSGSAFFDALKSLGRNLDALRLTGDDESLDDLGDGITPHRLINDLHIVPGLWRIDGYTAIARSLAHHYKLTPGENYFEFPYDWRRSNVVAARRLARESSGWLRRWRRSSGNADARLIFLAHSMGGLVVRWFAECLEGWRDTRMLVSFGTPYRGSLNAVSFVCNGMKKSVGPTELIDLTALLRSMTSVYQLLPIYPCIDAGGANLVRAGEARNLPNLDAARAAQALAFHRAIEKAVEGHRKQARYIEQGYRLHPIVGTFQPTWQSAVVREGGVDLLRTIGGRDIDGDGTVPRPSATPIELSGRNGELFIAQSHGALQNTEGVLVQLARLLQPDAVGWDAFRDDAPQLSLQLDDMQRAGEPIDVAVREARAGGAAALDVAVVDMADGSEVAKRRLPAREDGRHAVTLAPLPAGVYRLQVAGGGASVMDSFVVA